MEQDKNRKSVRDEFADDQFLGLIVVGIPEVLSGERMGPRSYLEDERNRERERWESYRREQAEAVRVAEAEAARYAARIRDAVGEVYQAIDRARGGDPLAALELRESMRELMAVEGVAAIRGRRIFEDTVIRGWSIGELARMEGRSVSRVAELKKVFVAEVKRRFGQTIKGGKNGNA